MLSNLVVVSAIQLVSAQLGPFLVMFTGACDADFTIRASKPSHVGSVWQANVSFSQATVLGVQGISIVDSC